ncbi:guanine nucleotide exchange factor for Rab-3A-like [Amphibalanus amphitrite]|uniref:guanine nucleotide exchange factor for Rab-3A-like n=1 Tax=Amphibalanus amphitrite TaxID=1232801 RepID=UPI001C9039D8|nr:guanine nucleotide exchange factor for Rab-3A-like [Amphibalanus amphitrite]XP_043244599.1 guanine nucleotide exchange factor for Rab-3A-like [Amphibalanus amphitrite]
MLGSDEASAPSEPEPPPEAVKPAAAAADAPEDAPDGRHSRVAPLAPSPAVSHVSLVELSLEEDGPAAGGDWTAGAAPRVRGLDKLQELERELGAAQQELKLKDEEVAKLNRIRNEIEAEMEELTASLFQEAHKMVLAANEKQAAAEKALQEATMKIDVLQAEVAALKTLVITSTPSRPNAHLHPQIDLGKSNGIKIWKKGHHRSPSNQELTRPDASPPSSPARSPPQHLAAPEHIDEVDPRLLSEVSAWRESPSVELTAPFVRDVYREDIEPCLRFATPQLTEKVTSAVLQNSVCIEEVSSGLRGPNFPSSDDSRRCALLNVHRTCRYRMKLPGETGWMDISQICRNRITAVCDFLNYLRYIERGMVKGSVIDIYREIMRLRRNMAVARLGFTT